MIELRSGLAFVLALVLLTPEVVEYRGDQLLRSLTVAFRTAEATPAGPSRDDALATIEHAARSSAVAGRLDTDARPLVLAGAACLLARNPERALVHFREALAHGERAEIVLNLARAHLQRRDVEAAQAALVRAGWVSPALVHTLPKAPRRSLLRELKLLARALRAGRLREPPMLAPADRAAAAG